MKLKIITGICIVLDDWEEERKKENQHYWIHEYMLDGLEFSSDMLLFLFCRLSSPRSEIQELAQSRRDMREQIDGEA